MSRTRMRFWRDASIQSKMLVIILPLIVVPMLLLAAVGFVTSSREAAKTSTRYLLQRETNLRTLAENPAIPGYANNRTYGLTEEAEVSRRELERSFKRFTDRSNSIDPVYARVSYVDERGAEVAKVVKWGRARFGPCSTVTSGMSSMATGCPVAVARKRRSSARQSR